VNFSLSPGDRFAVVAIACMVLYFFQPAIASAANRAPSISGTPATTGYVGKAYSFQPTASDPDGNKLTFKVAKKPVWATFSGVTGRLTGTPSASQTGTYSNIVISVSDGIVTKSLPAFTISVVQANSTSSPVTLSWVRPTQNVDGTQLSNLAGYRIHYGQVSGQYDYSVSVGSPSITSATIENLAPARWYFAVTSVTSSGTQSEYSAQLSKSVL
jgi:Putative Ig domain